MNPSCKTSNQPSSAPYHLHQAQKNIFQFFPYHLHRAEKPTVKHSFSQTIPVLPFILLTNSQFCSLSQKLTIKPFQFSPCPPQPGIKLSLSSTPCRLHRTPKSTIEPSQFHFQTPFDLFKPAFTFPGRGQ